MHWFACHAAISNQQFQINVEFTQVIVGLEEVSIVDLQTEHGGVRRGVWGLEVVQKSIVETCGGGAASPMSVSFFYFIVECNFHESIGCAFYI